MMALEVKFNLKHILQNAQLLRVMKIKIRHFLNQKANQHSLEELSLCSRMSPECKLSICFPVS